MGVSTISTGMATSHQSRVTAVDVLRGFVMVVMALDHTREFFTNWVGNPLDPQHTTFMLYLTRWMTHLCAPVFVFLAGTSIFLQRRRKTTRQLTSLLLTRGLWLIIVELTLVQLVFNFNWRWNVQLLEVIWAIGASMMLMAALIHLSVRWNLLIGALLIFGHNALDGVTVAGFGSLGWLWHLLHVPGLVTGPPEKPPIIVVAYPLLPWVGVMALGYAFGSVALKERAQRLRFELRAGAAMLAVFVLLRWSNLYGDPEQWTTQANWWHTLLSFFNVQKYPPSLLFLLATLGIAAPVMVAIESAEGRAICKRTQGVLAVYGRVPLFYFLLHIALIHLLALIISGASGGDWRWLAHGVPDWRRLDWPSSRLRLRLKRRLVRLDRCCCALLSRLQMVCEREESEPKSAAVVSVNRIITSCSSGTPHVSPFVLVQARRRPDRGVEPQL